MPIIEPSIRPPSEADSFLLQITTGCSANSCTFCGAYLRKPFKIKPVEEIHTDILKYASRYPDTRRVFLMDGDALAVDNKKLIPILDEINRAFPHLSKISSYANGYNVINRSEEELKTLHEYNLKLLYIGLESGNQAILNHCKKKSTAQEMIEAVQRASAVQIKSSVIVLLGLGGIEHSKEHVADTITALNHMQPRYLSFLSLMTIPGTPLYDEVKKGTFRELNAHQLLHEMHDIIKGLELKRTIFRTDHASNYLPLEGRFPHDKEQLLATLRHALEGDIKLRSEILRGL
ncbi:radical SAM protein [Candidatus Omnitrophota bacterium]